MGDVLRLRASGRISGMVTTPSTRVRRAIMNCGRIPVRSDLLFVADRESPTTKENAMSRLAWLANPQYLRYVVNKRIVVTAAIRARAGANSVLRVLLWWAGVGSEYS